MHSLPGPGLSLLDIGCFAGSLLSLADETRFSRQLGVDILPEQIRFATEHFGTEHRHFQTIRSLEDLPALGGPFDCASAIELIEHITPDEIRTLFRGVATLLAPGTGSFILSTPNYLSTWPLLELGLNRFSDVDYSEQHITRFNRLTVKSRLARMVPGSRAVVPLGSGHHHPPAHPVRRRAPRSRARRRPAPRFPTPAGSCPLAISSSCGSPGRQSPPETLAIDACPAPPGPGLASRASPLVACLAVLCVLPALHPGDIQWVGDEPMLIAGPSGPTANMSWRPTD